MHEEYQASAEFDRAVESYMEPDDDYPGPYDENF
jgi:hypothetical protein